MQLGARVAVTDAARDSSAMPCVAAAAATAAAAAAAVAKDE